MEHSPTSDRHRVERTPGPATQRRVEAMQKSEEATDDRAPERLAASLIVLSGLYLLVVVGLAALLWPDPATTLHRDEFIAKMPADLRANVDGAYSSKWAWEEAWKARIIPNEKAPTKAPPKNKSASETLPKDFVLESEAITFPNGAVLTCGGEGRGYGARRMSQPCVLVGRKRDADSSTDDGMADGPSLAAALFDALRSWFSGGFNVQRDASTPASRTPGLHQPRPALLLHALERGGVVQVRSSSSARSRCG
jgi:hypothetical protein